MMKIVFHYDAGLELRAQLANLARSGLDVRVCPVEDGEGFADIVSPHVPLDERTQHMIDEAALASMRRGSVLVNTARGGLVDEAALMAALRSGHLRVAGLDTFEEEPRPPDNPLLRLENVALMPHLAWLTTGTLDRSVAVAAENCRRLESGESLLHVVGV